MSLLKCKLCGEDPFICHHFGGGVKVENHIGSREFDPIFNKDATINQLRKDLAKTQISLSNVNNQIKKNKNEYNLKVIDLISKAEKLEKENDLIRSDLCFLTQPLTKHLTLDDIEECFKMLRKKWALDE